MSHPLNPPPPCSNMAHHKSTSWDILGMCCHPGFPSYLHPVIMGSGICWKGGQGVGHGNRAGVFLYFESVPLVGKTSLAGPEIVLRIWLHYVTVTWEPTWKPADQPTLSKETTIIFQKKYHGILTYVNCYIVFTNILYQDNTRIDGWSMVWICIPTPRPSKICPQTRKSRTKISHSVLGVDLFVFVMPLNIQEDLLLCNNRKKCQSAYSWSCISRFCSFLQVAFQE